MQQTDDEDTFEVDTTALSGLKVRKGFEKYGAKAVFAMDRKIKHIHVCEFDKDVLPGDEEWEHAKWVWKISVLTHVNIGPHFVELHWTTVSSNLYGTQKIIGYEFDELYFTFLLFLNGFR